MLKPSLRSKTRLISALLCLLSSFARLGFLSVRAIMRFLAAAAVAKDEAADSSESAERGDLFGVHNYRTGRLDAGDGPHGWYRDG